MTKVYLSNKHLLPGVEFTFRLDGKDQKCRILSTYIIHYSGQLVVNMVEFISESGITYNVSFNQLKGVKINLSYLRDLKINEILKGK